MNEHETTPDSPASLALALAGCVNLAPKYERPAAPVAGAFPTVEGTVTSGNPVATEAPASIAWQRFFTDARLQQLIALALANNRDLRVSIAEHRAGARRLPDPARQPVPDGERRRRRQPRRRPPGNDSRSTSVYQAGLSVSAFELDFFGRVRNLTEAALAQFLATEEARKTAQISLIAQVANTYLTFLADEELLDLTQQTLKTREESLRLTQLRFDNGVSSKLDLQQAVSLVEQARTTLAQAAAPARPGPEPADAAGRPADPGQPAAGATLATTNLPDLPAGLPSDLLAVRPDIRAAEQQLIAANANIGAARANYFPRISLTGSAGTASTELSGLFKSGTFGWTFAPQAILPMFDFGRTRAGVESARAQRDIAVAQYEKRSRPRSAKWRTRWPARPPTASSCAPSRPWRRPRPTASSCPTCATATAWPATSTCWTPSARCSPRSSRRSRPTWRACRTRSRCTACWAAAGASRDRRPRRAEHGA